ncbi:PH domain-containing protein [Georgenia sunbinii]|uniref:PH domain-containing protein n=1 Tax=Georgenia sunbinii TaxID=3117728 RepID=UPI002F26C227
MTTPAELYAPFRPRAARWVSLALLVATAIGTVALVVVMNVSDLGMSLADSMGTVAIGALIAWFCYRQATVAALPDTAGVTVRNLIVVRRLGWAEVVTVRYGDGRSWAQLDLADGDTIAVMGIQRADGDLAEREARRLATLVAIHEARNPN